MIKAIRKTSLIDFPNAVSSVIFTGGCDFSCPYCYNTDLVYKYNEMKTIPEDYVIDLLLSRKKFINHVVVTGGEPTIHDIAGFLEKLKTNGFKVKLDTNAHCENFESLLQFVDYVAIDFKAPFKDYEQITGVKPNIELLKKNFQLVKKVQHEFRSVIWKEHPILSNVDEVVNVIGDSPYFLQNVTLLPDFTPLEKTDFEAFIFQLSKLVNIKSRANL